jgi:uncharacterized protein (DUF1015 family)
MMTLQAVTVGSGDVTESAPTQASGVGSGAGTAGSRGLSLAPFRGLRPRVDPQRLGSLLSPPYDVIDAPLRERLLANDLDNAVAVILPEPTADGYAAAAATLDRWLADGLYAVDEEPALYVYEMRDADGRATRGLVGAVELRNPADGVILPHENTMAGPVADRLEVMTATGADLEPIYLVYDGGGAASGVVKDVADIAPVAEATAPDGTRHRLWALRDADLAAAVAADLVDRHALIADGHHRYATYRERQRRLRAAYGPGPWDRGMALLVDTSEYGPQVHAIHRVIRGLTLEQAASRLAGRADVRTVPADPDVALGAASEASGFAIVLTDGEQALLVTDPEGALTKAAARPGDDPALTELDVTVLHRGVIEAVWELPDDEQTVGYAHSVADAIADARQLDGLAVLLRPTPVTAVAAVAAAGARMPRKSTLFTPKPASGLVMRRLSDDETVAPA